MTRRWLVVPLVLALLGAACSSGDADASSPPDDRPTTDAPATTTETTTTTAPAPTPEDIDAMSDEELAAEAYVAGFPLVVSTRTMQRLGGLLGTNSLFWQTALSGPDSRVIVAPNRDTLYSIAIIDLRGEPQVLTLPEVTDRYFTYQLLSPWTESFAYIGTRATGGRAGSWAIVPPGWDGEVPDGVEVVESPTPQVFLLGRWLVDDDADVANVVAIRDQSSLQPLSALTSDEPAPAPPPLGEPAGTAQDIPADATFFTELATALAVNPPATDVQRALFAAAEERLGLGTDAPLDDALAAGAAAGQERIDGEVGARAEVVDGWSVNREIGTYGDDLVLRALVARIGWGANVPEEAVYPVARVDADGAPLDGSDGRAYEMTFATDGLPPLEDLGFWSLSVYGGDMFFTPHPAGRWTIGDRTPDLTFAADGSLTITLAPDEPTDAANWLPVPDGPFVLMLRLYLPAGPILDGTWSPPGVTPVG